MASPLTPEDGDGFVCGPCQRGRCRHCHDAACTCCYGGDPAPWPASSVIGRLLARLRGPLMPCPA